MAGLLVRVDINRCRAGNLLRVSAGDGPRGVAFGSLAACRNQDSRFGPNAHGRLWTVSKAPSPIPMPFQQELTPKPKCWPSRPDDCILCAVQTLGVVLLADTLEPSVAPVNRSGTSSGSSLSAGWWPASPSPLLRPGTLVRCGREGVCRHPATFRSSVWPTWHRNEGKIQ